MWRLWWNKIVDNQIINLGGLCDFAQQDVGLLLDPNSPQGLG